jgi:hypothetical protein
MLAIKKIEEVKQNLIYFISDEDKKYIYVSPYVNDISIIEKIEFNIKNKIALNHRFKEVRTTDYFYGLTEDYPDIKYYSSYWDDFSKYSQELFGLIELTEDNLTNYLHKIM